MHFGADEGVDLIALSFETNARMKEAISCTSQQSHGLGTPNRDCVVDLSNHFRRHDIFNVYGASPFHAGGYVSLVAY